MEEKIKINETMYDPDKHIVIWNVTILSKNTNINLMYNADDVANCLLKKTDVKLSKDEALLLNEVMKGKEINWISTLETKNPGSLTKENIEENTEILSKYPIPNIKI